MNGLDKIIAQINAQGDAEVKKIAGETAAKSREILENAKTKAAELAAGEQAAAQLKQAQAKAAAQSSAELARRRALLKVRGELIDQVIEKARNRLETQTPQQAEQTLLAMARRYAAGAKGQVAFCERDLALGQAFFARFLQAAGTDQLTLCTEPAAISGGFVLTDGPVELDCSYRSLFESAREQMQDEANRLLFEP